MNFYDKLAGGGIKMDLKEYLFEHKIKQVDAAKEIGVNQVVISHLCNGRKRYSKELCDHIAAWTGGAVKAETMYAPVPKYHICPTCKQRVRER